MVFKAKLLGHMFEMHFIFTTMWLQNFLFSLPQCLIQVKPESITFMHETR